MRQSPTILFLLVILFIGFIACKTDNNIYSDKMDNELNDSIKVDSSGSRLRIIIGKKTFTATLFNNPTVIAFKAKLPMTIIMSELNGNEKLYNFSTSLPTNTFDPKTIHTGDLMIYGSNTLVLFYKTFSTQYPYTRLGRIDDTTGLADAVGFGNVTVIFELY